MAKSPTKFDTSTLTNALKQVYYIHKNIVADLNAKLDVLADENGKLQAQKSSGISGQCSSCYLLKDMNQRLQETFNILLKDKEATIKSLSAKLGKLSKENSGKDLDTSDNLESSELLENKLTRREGESHEAQREKNENHSVNINEENNDTKTHSKLQLLRQGKRSIRYIEEVPNPKRMKVSPTDNQGRLTVHHHSSNLASVKWAAMFVPETEPDAIQKKHETSGKPDDLSEIESLSEHLLIVPETIGLDYTIRNVECDNSIVENERDNNGHGIARADSLSAANNDNKMVSKGVVHLEDCSLTHSHSDRTEESQEPCTQITNRKLMSKGSPAVVKTMKGIGVEKENGKLPDGLSRERNQSGAGSTFGNSLEIHEAVKDVTNSNKINPNGQASRKPTEDKGRLRNISDKSAERSMGEPVSVGTEINQQVPRGDKLSEAKKKSQLSRSEQQQQASKNSVPKFIQPTSPSSSSSAAPKLSPKETVHLVESKQYSPSVKLRGIIGQNSVVVHKQVAPPSPSNFLNDSGDLKDKTKMKIVEKIIDVNSDPNGSMNPDVNLSEILASQTSAKAVSGRQHSQSSNKVMNAFDETIAPSSLLQHEVMNAFDETIAPSSMLQHDEAWRPDVTSPAKSSQQFSSTLDEGTLKATQGSSTPHNSKRSLECTSPMNGKSTLKSLVSGGKIKSDIPKEKSKLHVTNSQKKSSSYNSSGMYDKVNSNDEETDDDDDESIAPSPQAHFQAGSQLHCSIPSSSRSFKFSHKPNKFHVRSDSTTAVKLPKDSTNKNAINPSSVSVRLVGDEGESLDLQAALEEIDRSQTLNEENLQQSMTEVTSPQKSSKQYSPVQSFEDSFDRVPKNKEVEFPHVEVVRKKSEREKLEGFSCRECYEYYKTCGLSEEEMKQRMNQCSRHRHKFVAPATPEHFWSLGFPDTAEIMERSTLSKMDNETPAPAEKGPRRRRRLEKKF